MIFLGIGSNLRSSFGNKIDNIIRANDISRVIDLYTKKSKNRKIIKNCLSSKPIKLKKLLSILK